MTDRQLAEIRERAEHAQAVEAGRAFHGPGIEEYEGDVTSLLTHIDAQAAELARMRPVVEAAVAEHQAGARHTLTPSIDREEMRRARDEWRSATRTCQVAVANYLAEEATHDRA